MAQIEFIFENNKTLVQCQKEEMMKDIFKRYASKTKIDINSFYFVYGGNKINDEIKLSELITDMTSINEIKILVFKIDIPIENIQNIFIKPKYARCPECGENIKFKIINYKINIYGCRNMHKINNILLNEYEKIQSYDLTKIVCEQCKNKNKKDIFDNEFYKCYKCNINLCPLCKTIHDKTHNIINPDKNYICNIHNESYSKYCDNCHINLCMSCEGEHKGHSTKYLGDIIPNINEIKNKMKELKKMIDSFKSGINEIIDKLNLIKNNLDNYYKINEDIINNYDIKNRNYEILQNINELNKINNITEELNEINNDKNLLNKLNKLFTLYKMMTNKEEKNDKITIRYKFNPNEERIKIFGKKFVENNKNICKVEFAEKEFQFQEYFNNKEYKLAGEIDIGLRNLNYVTNLSYMFYGCSSLLSLSKDSFLSLRNSFDKSIKELEMNLKKDINNSSIKEALSKMKKLYNDDEFPYYFKWDTNNVTNMSYMFFGCSSLKSLNKIGNFNTSNVIDMSNMFSGCSSLSLKENSEFFSKWDLRNVINMSFMFYGCHSINNLYIISEWNINNVKDMSYMFYECLGLENISNISNWDTENVNYMNNMFNNCKNLKDISPISKWNKINIINMSYMFSGCSSLQSLSNLKFDLNNVIYLNSMFKGCTNLCTISNFNLNANNVINMSSMFEDCKNLSNITNITWNINNVLNLSAMFKNCSKLSCLFKLNLNISNVNNIARMFEGCEELSSLTELKNWNTSNVIDMSYMFSDCKKLSSLSGLEKWNTSNVINMNRLFSNCKKLSSLKEISTWDTSKATNMMIGTFLECKKGLKKPSNFKNAF